MYHGTLIQAGVGAGWPKQHSVSNDTLATLNLTSNAVVIRLEGYAMTVRVGDHVRGSKMYIRYM